MDSVEDVNGMGGPVKGKAPGGKSKDGKGLVKGKGKGFEKGNGLEKGKGKGKGPEKGKGKGSEKGKGLKGSEKGKGYMGKTATPPDVTDEGKGTGKLSKGDGTYKGKSSKGKAASSFKGKNRDESTTESDTTAGVVKTESTSSLGTTVVMPGQSKESVEEESPKDEPHLNLRLTFVYNLVGRSHSFHHLCRADRGNRTSS